MTTRWRSLVLLGAGVATAAGVLILLGRPELQDFIENSGVHIPTRDVIADYAWGVAWALLLLGSIALWPIKSGHKKILAAAWLIKCAVALVLMLPYEQHYYDLDCWNYFQRAHLGLSGLDYSFSRGGSELVAAVGAIHLWIGPDSYHAMKLTFAMCGLVGLYFFYLAATAALGRESSWFFWALILYPSILFWSSILGKDPLILLAMAVHAWGLANMVARRKHAYLIAVILGVFGASAVRVWMGPILILPCIALVTLRVKHMVWRSIALAAIVAALSILGAATAERLAFDQRSDVTEFTRALGGNGDRANSSLHRDAEWNSVWDLAAFVPGGMFDAYFRPLPGDVEGLFGWVAGLENLGLLLLCLRGLFRIRLAHLKKPLFFWGLGFLLTWGLAYSIVAAKDLGTAVRFKLQVLPILLGVVGSIVFRPQAKERQHQPLRGLRAVRGAQSC